MNTNKDHPWVGVDAIILNDMGRILLEKRASTMDTYPGCWCLPGGWMEWGEKVEDAVKREVREEIGVEIEVIKFIGQYFDTNNLPIKKHSRIALPHICKIVSGVPKVNQIEEVEEIKWIDPNEALNLDIAYDQKDMIRYVVDNGLI
ncbi:MAG: 8-oxo-dGTP diphosphatase [Patescibacteria group bacterium]|nr:8-oxo-dGTP diphosphatase [Patescibacteria group bacterium]